MKILATKIDVNSYRIETGDTLKREYDSLTPNGNRLGGRWALRDQSGFLVDYDRYINDLSERNNLYIYSEKSHPA